MTNQQVKDIMSSELITIHMDEPVATFKQYFKRRGIHHILVEDKLGDIVGIISTEDVARSMSWVTMDELLAEHIMMTDMVTIKEDASLQLALAHFLENRYRALPVRDESGEIVGIITPYDLLSTLSV